MQTYGAAERIASFSRTFSSELRNVLKLKDYKVQWVRDRVQELRDSGLKDAAIARRMGIKPPWFNEAIKKDSVGDDFIDRLCTAFNLRFPLSPDFGNDRTAKEGETVTVDAQQFTDLLEQVKTQTRLLNLVLDQLERRGG